MESHSLIVSLNKLVAPLKWEVQIRQNQCFSLNRSMTVCTAVGRPMEGGGWAVDHRLLHDGRRLSQISAGAALADRVVLGSPFSRGVLVCGQ
jgi:hypothetical protein